MRLSVHVVHRETGSATVVISGDLDLSNSGMLEGVLMPLAADGHLSLFVNGQGLRFCDLSGARTLRRVHERVQRDGGSVVLTVQRGLGRLLDLLWPGGDPGSPTVLYSLPRPDAARRHLAVMRGVNPDRLRARAGRAEAVPAALPLASVLERSRALRRETAERLEIMRAHTESLCTVLADVQDRLAAIHVTLVTTRPVGGPAGALLCDGHSHEAKAEELRLQATALARQ
ncbi:STAS domain-containing protein [Microbispora sp. NPDC049125]|uniref:STAS domain-containing protein n=1 Tax=Microbispora sp. NPDC049125 TaxID=3154929 RepID=UPI0034669D19